MIGGSTLSHREHDIDWRQAAASVVWVPEAHRRATMSAAEVRRALRCTAASFDQLCGLGLRADDSPDGPLFDVHDVQNVGLLSGTGLTDIEAGMRIVLGFMHADHTELVEPRRWQFELTLRGGPEAGARLVRRVYRPLPELVGGALESCTGPVDGVFVKVVQASSVTGTLVTRGKRQVIRAQAIGAVLDDLVASGIRWQFLPGSLAADPTEALALGVGACRSLSATVADLLRQAGFEARAYRGWMVALSSMGHGWVEVVDDDGEVKWLDPSLSLLATVNGFGPPAFAELVAGSVVNRIVPTRAPGDASLYADGAPDDDVELVCRAAPRPTRRMRVGPGRR